MSTINESEEKSLEAKAVEARTSRRHQCDEHGHLIPPTDAEREARSAALRQALAEMAAIPDDPPGSDEQFWRAMDEARPDYPLFKELYEP
jgi:hypothetical protein